MPNEQNHWCVRQPDHTIKSAWFKFLVWSHFFDGGTQAAGCMPWSASLLCTAILIAVVLWPASQTFCHLQSKDTNNLITSKTPTHLTLAGSEASNAAHHAATLIAKEKCFDNAPFGLGQKQ
jgi:hypothetical protein